MMFTIHKYPLQDEFRQELHLHEGYTILSVQMQREQVCLWAMVDTNKPLVKLPIRMCLTGGEVYPDKIGQHIATVQVAHDYVVHYFHELTAEPRKKK